VIVHGSHDPMMRIRNGRSLARIVKGARFVVVDGMGHDLPRPVWRPVVDALVENIGTAAPS
jgi:pimeloyl-ACP methyl ester carboxylesterase